MPAPSAPPSLTAPPTAPSRNDAPPTFISRMNAFLAWIITFVSEMGTMATALYAYATSSYTDAATANTKAGEAAASASDASDAADIATTKAEEATTKAGEASDSADDAAASALLAAQNAAGFAATSTTSMTLGAGSKTLTIQTGKQFGAGDSIKITRTSDPANVHATATVDPSGYDSATGVLNFTIAIGAYVGTGPYTDWTVKLSGEQGPQGDAGVATPWTQIGATQTISTAVASIIFTSIPTTYSQLLLEVIGLSPSGNANINLGLSANGVTYTTVEAYSNAVAASSLYGAIVFPKYTADAELISIGLVNATSTPTLDSVLRSGATGARHDGGVNYIRVSTSSGNLDAGSLKLWAM